MDITESILLAIGALKVNKLRTILTMLGIIIGISSVILIYAIGQGAVKFITNELASFGTDYFQINPGKSQLSTIAGSQSLTMEDFDAIRLDKSPSNIKDISPIAMTSAVVSANDAEEELLVYGSNYSIVSILRPDILYGEFITQQQEESHDAVVVLGKEVAEKFFGTGASPIGESVTIKDRSYFVIGVINSTSALASGFINNALFMPINLVTNEITGEEGLQEIDISVHDTKGLNQTMKDVEQLLRERHSISDSDDNDFRIASATDIINTTETITSLLTVLVSAISAISLIVGGVGVMNIMLVSVTERTKEIGLLKAIGAREKDILFQFLIESVVMSCIGGIIGILFGITGSFILCFFIRIPFVVSIESILIAVSVSSSIGIVFGLYPAKRAAKLSPIVALQYQ